MKSARTGGRRFSGGADLYGSGASSQNINLSHKESGLYRNDGGVVRMCRLALSPNVEQRLLQSKLMFSPLCACVPDILHTMYIWYVNIGTMSIAVIDTQHKGATVGRAFVLCFPSPKLGEGTRRADEGV